MVPDFVLHSLITTTPLFTVNGIFQPDLSYLPAKCSPCVTAEPTRTLKECRFAGTWIQCAGIKLKKPAEIKEWNESLLECADASGSLSFSWNPSYIIRVSAFYPPVHDCMKVLFLQLCTSSTKHFNSLA